MYDKPDSRGHFGPYGGVFVSETLMFALEELKQAYADLRRYITQNVGVTCSVARKFT